MLRSRQHTSFGQPSVCTAKAVRTYFENGTLPLPGTKCQPDVELFSDWNATDVLEPVGNLTKRAIAEDNDRILLAAVKQLGTRHFRTGKVSDRRKVYSRLACDGEERCDVF